jgi:hypothetical protein
MCANKNNNSVTKLGEINGKKIQVTQWRNSFLLNYNSNALNLQFDPFTLTKLGLYPDKSQVNDDSKYMDSKRFNLFIPFDDLSEENLQKLRELDIFFKTSNTVIFGSVHVAYVYLLLLYTLLWHSHCHFLYFQKSLKIPLGSISCISS